MKLVPFPSIEDTDRGSRRMYNNLTIKVSNRVRLRVGDQTYEGRDYHLACPWNSCRSRETLSDQRCILGSPSEWTRPVSTLG